MEIQYVDFNKADEVITSTWMQEWTEVENVLTVLPLHLKASDQDKIQGTAIFDAVGTNEWIKTALVNTAWHANVPIPKEYEFLGQDIDFYKSGVIIEIQFSNYPFLLNNLLRSELFYKAKTAFLGTAPDLLIIVTKAHMFPASNSTLYYEQAVNQITELTKNNLFDMPIRVVGLFAPKKAAVPIKWTEYHAARYSRTVVSRTDRLCTISPGRSESSRCILQVT